MPLALEPNATFDVVLDSDKTKPKGTRPTFVCRYLSCRTWREVAETIQNLEEDNADGPAVMKLVIEQLNKCVVGWRNMAAPGEKSIRFSLNELPAVIDLFEAMELLKKALEGRPDATDLKNSRSPSGSKRTRSAKGAGGRKRVKK